MRPIPGARPPDPKDLVRVRDRLTFLYVERCTINRDSNAITVADGHGIAHVPAAALSVLLLGPGVRITHSAVSVLSESGSTIVWVGENGGAVLRARHPALALLEAARGAGSRGE